MLAMTEKPKTPGQLAFEALEYVTLIPGNAQQIRAQREAGATTLEEAAILFGLNASSLHAARRLLKNGTADEIAAVKAGTMSLHSALLGEKHRATPVKERGNNPARLEAYRLESHVWQQFRAAIEALAALPAQADVAKIARGKKTMRAIVDNNLESARKWLEEFNNVWNDDEKTKD